MHPGAILEPILPLTPRKKFTKERIDHRTYDLAAEGCGRSRSFKPVCVQIFTHSNASRWGIGTSDAPLPPIYARYEWKYEARFWYGFRPKLFL
jgi:hypothetical protein